MKWVDSDGIPSNELDLGMLKNVKMGCFKFTFIGLSEPVSNNICRLINSMVDNRRIELGIFAQMLQKWRVAYRLQFSANEALSAEENLKIYAEDFLPFYRKMLDKGILIEI